MTNFKRFLTLFFIAILSAFTMHIWGTEQTASKTIAQIASANSWANSTRYTSCSLDANITASVSGGANTGKYYSASPGTWRLYANESATLTITAATGCTLQSITISFSPSDNGTLLDGSTVMTSGSAVSASGTSHSFSVSQSSGTKGKIFISGISVTYDDGEGGGGTPTLSSIAVKTAPTKLSYTEGEYFDPTGLVITRTYSDDTHSDWTYADHTSDFTFSPSLSTALTTSDASVTITYGGKSTTQAITVTSGGGGGSTATFVWGTNPTKYDKGSTSETEGLVTFTGTKGTGSTSTRCWDDGLRMYAGSTASFSVPSGYVITQITGYSAFAYSSATGLQTVEFTGLSAGTCKSDVTVTYAPVVSYTVTATVDDAAHGSVSVTGNTITVTPNAGWVPDSYTVTSGTATAAQSGNIFTVTPSSDCTVQINFHAASTYTVTIIDNGSSHNETATEGVPFALPDDGASTCEDATFLGWATGEYTDHLAGTTIAPTYDAPGASKDITANTTFVAVYGTGVEDASDEYTKITSVAALTTGDYIIAAHGSYAEYAMKNEVVSSSYMDEESLTKNENPITTTDATIIWHITKTGSNYTIYNANINKYLATSTSSGPILQAEPHNFTIAYSGSNWVFQSTTNEYYITYNGYFRSLSAVSTDYDIYVYKRGSGIGSYTSKPKCCQAPATALSISSETTNFIGSGTTTVSISGGNAQAVTWSCKDEADNNCNSYLSGSGTTRTLTLPTNAATKTYTVTVTQPDNDTDPENVICGATVNVNITVKAQFTINFKTVDGGSESLYSSITVTDGDTYEMPSLAEDFDCGTSGKSFMGWGSTNDATSVAHTAGSSVTATASTTWYACWSTSSDVTLVYLYEKVKSTGSLAAGNVVLICNTGASKAMGEQRTNNRGAADVTSYTEDSKDYVYFTGTDVREFTVGKSGDYFTFYDATESGYLYASSSSKNYLNTQTTLNDNGKWALVIASDGDATVTAQGSNTHNLMRYNTSALFAGYTTGQQAVVFYKKTSKTKSVSSGSGSITTDIDGCTSGPTIRVNNNQWITAAKSQKVKTIIDVAAKNFEDATTLSVTSSNAHFVTALAATAVPAGTTGLATTLTIEYTPTESDITESTTITFTAGDITKTITINGRSVPEEFLLITKKTLWYALPANMNDGPNEYAGVEVTPDDGTEPTMVSVAPSTVLYSLHAVTDGRYADHGTCVRLAGYSDLCLWSNKATGDDKVKIQNKVNVATASGDNYEWLLTTTDGVRYTIANPSHPQYGAGRRLAYGDKFGLYQEPTVFYIVTAGCTSLPEEVRVSARRVDATFTWISNAPEMTIDLYSDEGRTSLVKSETATGIPHTIFGLSEKTTYWYTLTPGTDVSCAITGSFTTTGPVIDIVEWEVDNAVVFVDKDESVTPKVIIDGEVEHGVGTGASATELFFSKYFEGSGNMKLLAIFNGTSNDIPLTNYKLYIKTCGTPADEDAVATSSYTSTYNYNISALGSIKAGQEIVFYRWPGKNNDLSTQLGQLYDCSKSFLNEQADKSGADEDVRWIKCDGSTVYSGTTFPAFTFNGNDAICLEKNDALIDVIGALGAPGKVKNCITDKLNDLGWSIRVKNIDYGKESDDPAYDALYAASSKNPTNDTERRAVLAGFNVNLDDEYIDLTTARCILFRDKRVTSGDSAVIMNAGEQFVTCTNHIEGGTTYLPEWNGRKVCMSSADRTAAGVSNDARATCNSYQDLGAFDYSSYYKDWTNIDPGLELDEHIRNADEKTYNIPIPDLAKYSCLNIRFQLKDGDEVLTETPVQVPILVTGAKSTNNAIFNEIVKTDLGVPVYDQSITRCQTCDVVILGDGTLTKATDGATHDAPQVGNLKIYPGGKLVVPNSTHYTVNTLSFRRQEDAISSANIKGSLNVQTTNGTYLDLRIDPTDWHFISLPYDCKVSDIIYSDGITPAKLGSDYLLQWYNGERRAATKNDDAWEPVAADATLKRGLGYIFALPGDGKVKREFRFPMSNDVITEEYDNKIVGSVYGYGCDQANLGSNHKGWNLVGAPYLMPYTSDITSPLRTGKIVEDYSPEHMNPTWDGSWTDNGDGIYYIAVPINNGWDYYYQTTMEAYPLQPFTSYFVQVGGSDPTAAQGIEFHATSVPRSIVRRAPKEYEEVEDTHPVWCQIELTNPLGETDQTTILVSNDFTDKYDMQRDFVKMRGAYYEYYTRPVLASRNNEGEMAFNALPDASAEAGIPLNYFAATNGEYTIAYNDCFDKDQEVKAVMLLDKQKNEWYDLMSEPYEFNTSREENTTRFVLVVRVERKKAPEVLTDFENIGDAKDGPRKLLINGHVYIQRGARIYDVTGKQVQR